MIDRDLRRSLVARLQLLLGGAIDRGSFDDAFLFRLWSTEDRGVKEVATLCNSLFATKPGTKRAEKFGVESEEMSQLLQRAVTFLQSELEYEWPEASTNLGRRFIIGLSVFMLLPVVMAFAVFGMPASLIEIQWFMSTFAFVSVAIMFYSLQLIAMKPAPVPIRSKRLEYSGDVDVWPFFRRGDLALNTRRPVRRQNDWT